MKTFTFIMLLCFSSVSSAVTINETSSERVDEAFLDFGITNLDVSTGLEWLSFGSLINGVDTDVTYGYSVDDALTAYSPQGYRLASYTEVTGLFNLFFPTFVDSGDGTMSLNDEADFDSDLVEARNSWLFSFGSYTTDDSLSSIGFYEDDNGMIQELGIDINFDPLTSSIYGLEYSEFVTGSDEAFANRGVFLVRDFETTVVPVPASVWLFGSGLIGLVGVARRKKLS